MKQLIWVILAMLVLGMVVPGCGEAPRYDSRLTAADSLIHDHVDSALAILEALSPDDLATEGDRAYYDLLLTQSRYKACIPATSDSDINRALSYYKQYPKEREKLTRVFIYKGAVMEELDHPDSAMIYYKHAEATAALDDYFNQGYTKMRMGALYNDFYSIEGLEAVKHEEALECFKKAKDSVYILICLNNLGCMYRENKPKKAESMLLEASGIARHLHDTIRMYYNNLSLVVLYCHQDHYEKARQLIQEMSGFKVKETDFKMYFTAASVYARLGILDTAEMYHNIAQKNHGVDEPLFKMYYLRSLSEIALAKKDTINSLLFSRESDRIEDSLTSNDKKLDILQAEVSHDKESVEKTQFKHKSTVNSYQWLIGFLVCVSALILSWVYRRAQRKAHRYDSIISDLKEEITNQSINMNTLQNNINHLKISDERLKESLYSHMIHMSTIIEECYHSPNSALSKSIKNIIHYQERNRDLWENLYVYIDLEYNNLMKETKQRYPLLNDRDLLLLALSCLGYSCAQIALIMGYANATTIGGNKQRLARKMGLDGSLKDYIEKYKSKS